MRQPRGHNESVPHIHVSETLFNRYNADTSTGLYSFPQCAAFSPFINRKHQKIRPKDVDILTVQNGHIYTQVARVVHLHFWLPLTAFRELRPLLTRVLIMRRYLAKYL